MCFKIGILKNFAKLTGKHLCLDLFLIKLQALRPAFFLKKKNPTQVLPVDIPKFYTVRVSWGLFLLISRLHGAFDFNQKLTQNVAQIVLYYTSQKKFSLLELIDHLLSISEFIFGSFRFWRKTYTKRCANGYVISRVKRFFCLHIAVNQVLFNFRTLPLFNLFIGKKFF